MTRSFSFELNPGECKDRKVYTFNLCDDFYVANIKAADRMFRTYLVITTEYTHTLSGLMTVKNDYGYEYYGRTCANRGGAPHMMRLRYPFRADVVERLNETLTGIVRGHQMQAKYYSHIQTIKRLFTLLRKEGFDDGHRAFRNYLKKRSCYKAGHGRALLTKKAMVAALGPWLDTECLAISKN